MGAERLQEGRGRLDVAAFAVLGRFDLPRLVRPGALHVHTAAFPVDVRPVQCRALAPSEAGEQTGQDEGMPPGEQRLGGRNELRPFLVCESHRRPMSTSFSGVPWRVIYPRVNLHLENYQRLRPRLRLPQQQVPFELRPVHRSVNVG